jgi:hypothetical protein
LTAAGVVQLAAVNGRLFQDVFDLNPLRTRFHFGKGPPAVAADDTIRGDGPDSPMLRGLMRNRDVVNCYEPLQLIRRVRADRPLVWVDPPAAISDVTFSPARITFTLQAGDAPARVHFNQNFADGWRSSLGSMVLESGGNGEAVVVAGAGQDGRFAFTFRPPWLILSGLISAVTLLVSILSVAKSRRRRVFEQ